MYGWDTGAEEDIWEVELDLGSGVESDPNDDGGGGSGGELTIGEVMEWRYLKAEREKESVSAARESQRQWSLMTHSIQGNAAFRTGDYNLAVQHYEKAHEIEPELPHYQLNLAAAHLKLNKCVVIFPPERPYIRCIVFLQLDAS